MEARTQVVSNVNLNRPRWSNEGLVHTMPDKFENATLGAKKEQNFYPKGTVINCLVIYPFQQVFRRKFFLRSKLYNYFSPSDIPLNIENNKFNLDI